MILMYFQQRLLILGTFTLSICTVWFHQLSPERVDIKRFATEPTVARSFVEHMSSAIAAAVTVRCTANPQVDQQLALCLRTCMSTERTRRANQAIGSPKRR